jgi:hypothetical protein
MNAALDLNNCNLEEVAKYNNIDTHSLVKRFIIELCDYIHMVRDGNPEIYNIDHH